MHAALTRHVLNLCVSLTLVLTGLPVSFVTPPPVVQIQL